MSGQPARSFLTIALAIVIAAVLISASLFFAIGQTTKTVTTTTTVSSVRTVATQTITSTVYTSVQCTVSGPTIGAVIRVMDGTNPVPGVRISGQAQGYCNDFLQVSNLPPVTTNSSGWASMLDGNFGYYDLVISHAGFNYSLSISMAPIASTYVTFDISSGQVTTHVCYYNENCLANG
jgi:hypothetical protein